MMERITDRLAERPESELERPPMEAPNHFQPIQPPVLMPPDKSPAIYNLAGTPPMEPQNLKIKQEIMPPEPDPLQSLKEVKVPGFQNNFPGPTLENIKKDPDSGTKPPTPSSKHSSNQRYVFFKLFIFLLLSV